jgi:salicylate hydroxylase
MTNLVDSQAFRVIHRHDYHAVLLKEARKLNAEIQLGVSVENIDFAQTLVQLGNGKVLKGDVIVGADGMSNSLGFSIALAFVSSTSERCLSAGLWSTTRDNLLRAPSPPVETGDLAYRGTFSRAQLLALHDPWIEALCAKKTVTAWMGPEKHCVFYPVRAGAEFNLVLLRPDNLPTNTRTVQGDIGEMRATFDGWDKT